MFWNAFTGIATGIYNAFMVVFNCKNHLAIRKAKAGKIKVTIISHRNNSNIPCYYLKFENIGEEAILFSFDLPEDFLDAIPIQKAKDNLKCVINKKLHMEGKRVLHYPLTRCNADNIEDLEEKERTMTFLQDFINYEIKIRLKIKNKTREETLVLRWFDTKAAIIKDPNELLAKTLSNRINDNLLYGKA